MSDPVVTDVERLSAAEVAEVLGLLRSAAAADGVRPVSEEGELRLRHDGPPGGRNLLVPVDGGIAGYARLDDGAAELVVHPAFRRRGLGTALMARLEELTGVGGLSVWAHGDLPGSSELAASRGYTRARVLLQMRLHVDVMDRAGVDPETRPDLPDDVTVRPFRPGRDEDAWLRVNARAFARHPEQGAWTRANLLLREAEGWFDPEGFLMAWRGEPDDGGTLLGFHWTKVHPAGDVADERVGEVYVLGVHPDAQGMHLGAALTDLGLAHLRALGLGTVMLYVEESNAPAVRLYEARGFTRFSVDVAWHRDPSAP